MIVPWREADAAASAARGLQIATARQGSISRPPRITPIHPITPMPATQEIPVPGAANENSPSAGATENDHE